MNRWNRVALSALILAAAGCSGIGVSGIDSAQAGAGARDEIVVNGIRAVLHVAPTEVERTHAFSASMTLTNTLATPATWTSGMGCMAFLNVYRSGSDERIPLRGTDFGCLAVVTTRELAPGESQTAVWDLVAQTTDGTALPPGTYTLEADPVLAGRQTLRHDFRIR
jgi:hypothetical protein